MAKILDLQEYRRRREEKQSEAQDLIESQIRDLEVLLTDLGFFNMNDDFEILLDKDDTIHITTLDPDEPT